MKRKTPTAATCRLLSDALLFARAIRQLLEPHSARLDRPGDSYILHLREALTSITAPEENIRRALWESSFEDNPDAYFLVKLAAHADELKKIHRRLRFVGRFSIPTELESALRLALEDCGLSWPSETYLASTGDFRLLELQTQERSGHHSVVTVPAAFTVLPLHWPLIAHELGHRLLRTPLEGNVSLEALVSSPAPQSPSSLAAYMPSWRSEICCDRYGTFLFGGAFVAPMLSYFGTFYPAHASLTTPSHPAPATRWRIALDAITTKDPLAQSLRSLHRELNKLLRSTGDGADATSEMEALTIRCVACNRDLAEHPATTITAIDTELAAALAALDAHLPDEAACTSPEEVEEVSALRKTLGDGLPVDISFSGRPDEESLRQLVADDQDVPWEDMLSSIHPHSPNVASIMEAAWLQRAQIESDFLVSLPEQLETQDKLRQHLDDMLAQLQYLGTNVSAGIRTLHMQKELLRALSSTEEESRATE